VPIYEYRAEDTGTTVEVHYPVGKAPDSITLRRVRVPRRIATVGIARKPTQGDSLIEGYRKLEEKGGHHLRKSSFTPEQIKHAASLPDT
jgi:hypothetical protein